MSYPKKESMKNKLLTEQAKQDIKATTIIVSGKIAGVAGVVFFETVGFVFDKIDRVRNIKK